MPGVAFAQSTGTTDFENSNTVVVTGTRTAQRRRGRGARHHQDARSAELEFIQHQTPGQSINETINQLPGVSTTNNDPFGSAGSTMVHPRLRQQPHSETFDGVPLNDTGNYALFSNQLLDPEIIEQVNVSLGSTDVDSPTASATGSTINFRTRLPIRASRPGFRAPTAVRRRRFLPRVRRDRHRRLRPLGTRAFGSASMATNDAVYGNRGVIYKQQYNARIYQPIGSNGDFISIAAITIRTATISSARCRCGRTWSNARA